MLWKKNELQARRRCAVAVVVDAVVVVVVVVVVAVMPFPAQPKLEALGFKEAETYGKY